MPKAIKIIQPLLLKIFSTIWSGTFLCIAVGLLAGVFAGALAATKQLTLSVALLLVILLGLSLALIFTRGVQVKDLPVKKGILYLAVIAGFIGPAFLCFDIGPFSIFPFRILLPLLWLVFLLGILVNKGKLSIAHIKVKHYLLFLGLWLVYAILSLAWAADKVEAIRAIIFLFMGVSVIFFVVFYFSNLDDLKHFYNLWLLILVPLICIGLWEHTTGSHLSVSALITAPDRFKYMPSAVFHNPNDYATYLALSIPFVIAFIRYSGLIKRLFGMVILVLSLYLVVVTFSRANYLAIILGLAFWFLFLLKIRSKVKVLALAGVVVLLVLVALPGWTQSIFETAHVQLQSLAMITEPESSIGIRLNLIRNSLVFLANSFGFGIGAGNAEYYMASFQIYDTGGIVNVHNWWAEILVNYGIFIFVGYAVFYLGLITKLYAAYGKLTDTSAKMICEALLVGLVVFFFASISSSSIIALGMDWLFFAFALAFLNYYRIKSGLVKT